MLKILKLLAIAIAGSWPKLGNEYKRILHNYGIVNNMW